MSPRNTEAALPKARARHTATVALVAALLGGTGGIVITPRVGSEEAVSKTDLAAALAPMNAKLEKIETALIDLHAEAAVARYEREHRSGP